MVEYLICSFSKTIKVMINHRNLDKIKTGKIYYILPAFNEEKSLPNLLSRLVFLQSQSSKKLIVFVVDDGSIDSTASIATNGGSGLDVRLITHKINLGLGQAVQTGIKEVLNVASDDDIVIIMDADDTHDVSLLNPMIEKVENGSDIAIASRFVPGGDDSSAPLFRRVLSRGARLLFKKLLPLNNINDFTSGYRAYKISILRKASVHWGERLIEEQGFACMVELLLKLRHWSPVISEVPLLLRYDRKLGASKLKIKKTIFQYSKLGVRDRLSPPPRRQ